MRVAPSEASAREQAGRRVAAQEELRGVSESAKSKWMRWRWRAAGTAIEKKAPILTRTVALASAGTHWRWGMPSSHGRGLQSQEALT